MANIKNNIIIKALLLGTVFTSLSANASVYGMNDNYEYEGDLIFKVRGAYTNTDAKFGSLPALNPGAEAPKALSDQAYGADASLVYFFTPYIAAELGAGFNIFRIKNSALIAASKAFGDGKAVPGKNNEVYHVPATGTLQYHIAPFGAIRPYVGVGYHGSFMSSRTKAFKISNGTGAVGQIGLDIVAKDDLVFNIDVKQYILRTKVTFRKDFLATAKDVNTKVKWNPIVISGGIGFKF